MNHDYKELKSIYALDMVPASCVSSAIDLVMG